MPLSTPDGFKPKTSAVDKAFYQVINTALTLAKLQMHWDNCKPYRDGKPSDEPYTYGVLASDEELAGLKDLILRQDSEQEV
ncbi:MAG: hypothetical protein Q9161_003950 [Pseudevernia consocians]